MASRKRVRPADEALERTVQALLSRLPHYSQYSQFRMQPLEPDDPVYAHLQTRFVRKVSRHRGPKDGDPHREPPQLEVTRIEQIYSKRLQDKYLAEVCDVMGLCERKATPLEVDAVRVASFDGIDINEFLLYHGAPSGLIKRLAAQGLDPRNAGTNFGKLFGCGTYLASLSSKSDIYTKPNERGERCILVVRACLGEAHMQKKACRDILKPPERADKRGPLSSVVALPQEQGGCVEHPEYIVYNQASTLPQFAIYYKHAEGCKCTHCWRESDYISIKTVVHPGGEEIYFKLKTNTPLERLMDKFCIRQGVARDSVKFDFNGAELQGSQTPADLEMEDFDVVDVMPRVSASGSGSTDRVHLKVVDESDEVYFTAKRSTSLGKLMAAWCNRQGVPLSNVRFLYDGHLITESMTAADLKLEDGDVIDVEIIT